MPGKIRINFNGKNIESPEGITLQELVSQHMGSRAAAGGGCQGGQSHERADHALKQDCTGRIH